eukprot:403346877
MDDESDEIQIVVLESLLPKFVKFSQAQQIFIIAPTSSQDIGTHSVSVTLIESNIIDPMQSIYDFKITVNESIQNPKPSKQNQEPQQIRNDGFNQPYDESLDLISDQENSGNSDINQPNNPINQNSPTAYISSIDRNGLVTVKFDQKMFVPTFESANSLMSSIINSTALGISIIKNDDQDFNMLGFGWKLDSFSSTQMQIQLNFDNPLHISYMVRIIKILILFYAYRNQTT